MTDSRDSDLPIDAERRRTACLPRVPSRPEVETNRSDQCGADGVATVPSVEQSILGIILRGGDAFGSLHGKVGAEAFLDPRHRTILHACETLATRGEVVDLITVNHALRGMGKLRDAGGVGYLADLPDEAPVGGTVEDYLPALISDSIRRKLGDLGRRIMSGTRDRVVPLNPQIAEWEQELDTLRRGHGGSPSCLLGHKSSVADLFEADLAESPSLVDQMLYPGGCTFLVGDGGVGKTTLALQLVHALASGAPFLGHRTTPCRVGMLTLENPAFHVRGRLKALRKRSDDPAWAKRAFVFAKGFPEGLPTRWDLADPERCRELADWVLANELEVLVLDPLIHMHSLQENDSQDMSRVTAGIDRIRETNVAVVTLHHTARGNKSSRQRSRGSSVLYDYADLELCLERRGKAFQLRWSKDPRYEPAPPAMPLIKAGDGFFERAAKPEESRQRREGGELQKRIITILESAGKPMTNAGIKKALKELGLDKKDSTLWAGLNRLAEAGEIVKLDRGLYQAKQPLSLIEGRKAGK